ncbi:MAG: HlyD family efflux transporter periplasmic adaptor subunit [Spirochaetales bacterium]|nr:HlyD family efflux transporter periplasmic adaptor subunit [Spirochaetales bacterium]
MKNGGILIAALLAVSCSAGKGESVYMGRLEAEKTVISARVAGEIRELTVREGDLIEEGQILGRIDTESLEIQKIQQDARIKELKKQQQTALYQLDQARVQQKLNRDTLAKTENLLASGGATEQKRDELDVQVKVGETNLQILQTQYELLLVQEQELRAGMDLLTLSLRKAALEAPAAGTVLNRYHQPGELVGQGAALLETADLSALDLYIYLPLVVLPRVTIGQKVTVDITGGSGSYEGTVAWIASEGEFTPKTILTDETKDTLVYEVKIRVANDRGELKIGMPADVRF